jgi:hypothetical protein
MKSKRRKPNPPRSKTGAQWNYEPAEAWRGTVIVGKSERPTWWCASMVGTRRKCVKVQSWGEPFFIDDEDGRGSLKVFERGGGPDSYHASIPVDDADSFIPENVPVVAPATLGHESKNDVVAG